MSVASMSSCCERSEQLNNPFRPARRHLMRNGRALRYDPPRASRGITGHQGPPPRVKYRHFSK
jgi:hypothetical protein